MKMNARTGKRRSACTFHVVGWIVFIGRCMLAVSVRPTEFLPGVKNITPPQTSNSTSARNSNCGGSFWVGTTAKMISIPRTNDGTPVFCRWLLKAKDKHHTIALSTINVTMNLDHPHINFRLEARDGWKDASALIGSLNVSSEIFELNWKIMYPIKATSGFLLLQFWNEGYDPLLMDFVYYRCGGLANSRTYISSPVFAGLPLPPSTIDCQWQFTQPPDALYGYLKPIEVNISDCAILQMRSNGTMRVIEHVTHESAGNLRTIINQTSNSTFKDLIEWITTDNVTIPTPKPTTQNRTVVPICGDSIRLIAFDSGVAKLRYFSSNPQTGVGFRALYSTFKVPSHFKSQSKPMPWFLNYCALTIFTPIGVFAGGIIILYQARRRVPRKSIPIVITNLCDSPREGWRQVGRKAASFHSERNFRVGRLYKEKPPARRTKSLSNFETYTSSLKESRILDKGEDSVKKAEKVPLRVEKYGSKDIKITVPGYEDKLILPPSNSQAVGQRFSKSTECLAIVRKSLRPRLPPSENIDKKRVRFSDLVEVDDGIRTL